MFKPSVLVLALTLSSTALWSAFVNGSMSVTAALIRFLIAVPVAGLMLMALKAVTAGYHRSSVANQEAATAGEDELTGQTAS